MTIITLTITINLLRLIILYLLKFFIIILFVWALCKTRVITGALSITDHILTALKS